MKLWKAIWKTYTLTLMFAIIAMVTHAFPVPYTIVANVQTHYVVSNASTVTYQPQVIIKCPNLLGLKCQQIINGQQIIINVFHEEPREGNISSGRTSHEIIHHAEIDSPTNHEFSKTYEDDRNTDENDMMKDENAVSSNNSENLFEIYTDDDDTKFSNKEEGDTLDSKSILHSYKRKDIHSPEHKSDIGAGSENIGINKSSAEENGQLDYNLSQEYRTTSSENRQQFHDYLTASNETKKQYEEVRDNEVNSYVNSVLEENSKQLKESEYDGHDNDNNTVGDKSVKSSGETHDANNGIGESDYGNVTDNEYDKRMGNNLWDQDFSEKYHNIVSQENTGEKERFTYFSTEDEETTTERDEILSKELTTTASILSGTWWAFSP